MKRIYLFLLLTILFESCTNKSVQLPETNNDDITEIKDVSAAYLFYDETKKDSIEFNRKNLIGTTNWLVNVDKRLTLKQIMPSIIYLQNKRQKAGMHKNEAAKNYFTCSNPEIQNLAFIEFTDVVYQNVAPSTYFSKNNVVFLEERILIRFNSSTETVISSFPDDLFTKSSDTKILINDIQFITNNSQTKIILIFNQNLSFQDYISYKSLLLKLDLENVIIDNNEFIYN